MTKLSMNPAVFECNARLSGQADRQRRFVFYFGSGSILREVLAAADWLESDFVRAYPDLIRNWVPGRYTVLGTDGFGRSDTRMALRDFFEIDSRYITLAALKSLADEGKITRKAVAEAVVCLGINAEKTDPRL